MLDGNHSRTPSFSTAFPAVELKVEPGDARVLCGTVRRGLSDMNQLFKWKASSLFSFSVFYSALFSRSPSIQIPHDIVEDPDLINAKYYNPSHSNLEVVYSQEQGQAPSLALSAVERRHDSYPQQPQGTKLLGLPVPLFWTVVIGLVISLAGAIGGGIGGGLAASQHTSQSRASSSFSISGSNISPTTIATITSPPPSQSDSASPPLTTTSPTTTTSTQSTVAFGPPPAPTDNCPSVNGTNYTPLDASGNTMSVKINPGGPTKVQSFVRICNRNYPAGAPYGNPDTLDIIKLYLPTLEACIDACATYNIVYQANRPQRSGGGAQDGADIGLCRSVAIVKADGDYCYLKNATGKDNTFGNPERYSVGVLLI